MTFLKFIFWIALAVVIVLLWKDSPRVDLPVGAQYDVNARVMTFILLGFALGFLPLYLVQRTRRWRMARRIRSLETELSELRARVYPPVQAHYPPTLSTDNNDVPEALV